MNYNINQLKLSLTTDYEPKEGHIVYEINDLVESMNISSPYIFGRPREYDLGMMLKLLLYATAKKIFFSREIESLAEENLPARWLTQETVPSYRTICRFRISDDLTELINLGFDAIYQFLKKHDLIDDHIFVDGTKILADANKYSFVWKKNTIRYDEMNRHQIDQLLKELRETYGTGMIPNSEKLSLEELDEIITRLEIRLEDLDKAIKNEPKKSPNPNKQERRRLKSQTRKLKNRTEKMVDHQDQFQTFEGRNSFSKTDPDATFMRMKEDPMHNGQLKPGYNLQIATSQQFILAYDLFPNPSDTRTLIPFVRHHSDLFQTAKTLSADSAYGSQANYEFLEEEFPELTPLIPYNTYLKEQTKKWKHDPKKVMNWQYHDKDDYYIDTDQVRFNFSHYSRRKDRYNYYRYFKVYKAEKYTADQKIIPEALTPKGNVRTISINYDLEYFRANQRKLLSNPKNAEIYARRKVDVESAFGHLKACLGFTRFHVRGINGVKNEMGLALLAANLRKINKKT